jgi:HK97 gp10 family phage protein
MASVKMSVEGLRGTSARISAMGKKARPLMRKALRNGGKILAKSAKGKAPKETGNLKKSIKVRAGKRSRKWISVIVSMGSELGAALEGKANAAYAMQVEYGAPHRGQPARPVMRPAFDEQGGAAVSTIQEEVLKGMLDFEAPAPKEES